MRTAEEYIGSAFPEGYFKWMLTNKPILKKFIERAINKARKETIEECAERAKVGPEQWHGQQAVNKQSILTLINELE